MNFDESNKKLLENFNKIRLESKLAELEKLRNGVIEIEPVINKDCYFYHEEHDMGARIELP